MCNTAVRSLKGDRHPHTGGSAGTAAASRNCSPLLRPRGATQQNLRSLPGRQPQTSAFSPCTPAYTGRQEQTALGAPAVFQPGFTITIRRGEPPYFTALTARRSHELRERKRRHAAHGRGHLGREAAISGRRLVPAAPGPPPPARRPAPLRSPPPGPAAARWLPGAGAAGGIRRGLPSSPAHVEESRSAAAPPPPGAAPHRGRPQHGPGVARRERTLRPPRRLRHSPSRSRARCGPPRGGGTAAGRGAAGEGKRQRGAPAPGALVGQRAASVMGAGRAGGARHSGAWSPPALPAPRREAAAAEGGGLRLPESAAPLGLGRDERRAAAVPLGRSRPSSSPWKGSVRGCCGRCAGPSGTLGAGPAAGGRQAG